MDPRSSTVRVGGQALADGVMMRTDRAWALARADGSVEVGALPPAPLARLPGVRVLASLGVVAWGFLLRYLKQHHVRRPRTAEGRRFAVALAASVAVGWILSAAAVEITRSLPELAGLHMVALAASLAALRTVAPPVLWRYHGAEHKAVAAHEAGLDVDRATLALGCPRVHDRCGTNLVFLLVVVGAAMVALPPGWQGPAFLLALAVLSEVVGAVAGRPRSMANRVLLAGGRALQRRVTTAEPSLAEQAVGCRALAACLAEHERLAPAPSPRRPRPVAA